MILAEDESTGIESRRFLVDKSRSSLRLVFSRSSVVGIVCLVSECNRTFLGNNPIQLGVPTKHIIGIPQSRSSTRATDLAEFKASLPGDLEWEFCGVLLCFERCSSEVRPADSIGLSPLVF